jgi:hypothetical protein
LKLLAFHAEEPVVDFRQEDVKYLDPAVLKKLESNIDLASWRAAKGSGQNRYLQHLLTM